MKQERAYGIDLLRIVATIMVLTLHVFSNAGVLSQLIPGTSNYYVGWLLEAMCFCAVDIFAVTTGYLMVDKETTVWTFVPRWLQAWVISAGIMAIYVIFAGGEKLSFKEIMTYLFPVTYSHWKYLTEYFLVVLVMPLINTAIKHMSQNQHRMMLLLVFCLSVWTTGCFSDPINLNSGYSALWIVLLYIVGALVKKTGMMECISSATALLGYFLCACLAYGSKVIEVVLAGRLERITWGTGFLMNYVSPAILLCAVFLLIFFSHIKSVPVKLIPTIRWLNKVSFGVFLIHSHDIIRQQYYPRLFAGTASLPTLGFVLCILSSSVIIYLLCGMIDHGRQCLFDRYNLNGKIRWIYEVIQKWMVRTLDVFFG